MVEDSEKPTVEQATTSPENPAESPPELSEEEKKAAELASKLMQEDGPLRAFWYCQLAGRQLNSIGRHGMTERLAVVLKHKTPEERGQIEQILVGAGQEHGKKPFTVESLLTVLAKEAIPAVTQFKEGRDAAESAKNTGLRKQREQERRARPLPIGLDLLEAPHIPRNRPLVFVGYGPAVTYCLNRVVSAALEDAANNIVIRFGLSRPHCEHENYAHVATSWRGCADTNKSLQRVIVDASARQLRSRNFDLLVVDSLDSSLTQKWVGRPVTYSSAEALTRWRRMATKFGGGLVAGMPCLQATDLSEQKWATALQGLEKHAMVARITAAPSENPGELIYAVSIGDNEPVYLPTSEIELPVTNIQI